MGIFTGADLTKDIDASEFTKRDKYIYKIYGHMYNARIQMPGTILCNCIILKIVYSLYMYHYSRLLIRNSNIVRFIISTRYNTLLYTI